MCALNPQHTVLTQILLVGPESLTEAHYKSKFLRMLKYLTCSQSTQTKIEPSQFRPLKMRAASYSRKE